MFRLYVDEVGNHDLKSSKNDNERYFSLTGVIMGVDVAGDDLHPRLERLKRRHLRSHPDNPIILHRKEMVGGKHPFGLLRNPDVRGPFDDELLGIMREVPYVAITIALDKRALHLKYGGDTWHPYHYCMKALIERYSLFLGGCQERGDVFVEARGGREDRLLAAEFEEAVSKGTTFVKASALAATIGLPLVLKMKSDNIAGLQLADLLAHSSLRAMMADRLGEPRPAGFAAKILSILEETKYRRTAEGRIDGYGRRWLY